MRRRRGPQSFSSADRLHNSAEYRHLQRHGVRAESAHFVMYAGKFPGDERSRLGITVSRRIGGAVARNRVKRRVREAFRLGLRSMMAEGTAMVVIARPGAAELSSASIVEELNSSASILARRLAAKSA